MVRNPLHVGVAAWHLPVLQQSQRAALLREERRYGGQLGLEGSYGESCRHIDVDKHGRLSADCRKQNGKSNRSNITPQQCPSYRAGNRDGKLFCEPQVNLSSRWDGSFKQSCRDIAMNSSGTLTATCRTIDNAWQRTSLAPGNCSGYQAGNNDGRLVCESQGKRQQALGWILPELLSRRCHQLDRDTDGHLPDFNGNWQRTSLAPGNCNGYRAGNNNGQLVCEAQGNVSNRWDGSFQKSCRDVSMNSSGTTDGHLPDFERQLAANQPRAGNCNGYRAGNNNGQLVCESQGNGQQPLGRIVPEVRAATVPWIRPVH